MVGKRNVDLDPSKQRARDITLQQKRKEEDGGEIDEKNNNNHDDEDDNNNIILDIDMNPNLSQLYLDDDNMSDNGSLLGSVSNFDGASAGKARGRRDGVVDGGDNIALEHEITMQQNELSPNIRDRRSSFGIPSTLLGEMEIEIKFDDDEYDNVDILDESQAKRANIAQLESLTDIDDDDDDDVIDVDEISAVELRRGVIDNTLINVDVCIFVINI